MIIYRDARVSNVRQCNIKLRCGWNRHGLSRKEYRQLVETIVEHGEEHRRGEKTGRACSVENVQSSENHYIVGDGPQEGFAALAPVAGASRQMHQSLEHAVDGFDLPPLGVAREVQPPGHLPPPVAAGRLVRSTADQRRDQRAHATLVASVLMGVLRVVAGVQCRRGDAHAPQGLVQQRPEVFDVGPGPRPGTMARIKWLAQSQRMPALGKRPYVVFCQNFEQLARRRT